jgi:hypothetical protein
MTRNRTKLLDRERLYFTAVSTPITDMMEKENRTDVRSRNAHEAQMLDTYEGRVGHGWPTTENS